MDFCARPMQRRFEAHEAEKSSGQNSGISPDRVEWEACYNIFLEIPIIMLDDPKFP